ncbi:MAG TPA: hypothetical protein VFE47_20780 [Tepidisphaeraceae bacterium]|jgi:hypothetical protein|nr:hypothetical protein [Tepidisphaeraceae bacterium]
MQKPNLPALLTRGFAIGMAGMLLCLASGCPQTTTTSTPPGGAPPIKLDPVRLQAVNLTDVAHPAPHDQPVVLSAARNEWTNFTVQISLPASQGYWLHVRSLEHKGGGSIGAMNFQPFQVLAMPVDMDRAGYVRHSGQVAERRSIPRALLPQAMNEDGTVNLNSLRNPAQPTDPRSHAGGPGADPAMLWFDLHIPKGTPAGLYTGQIDLMSKTAAGAQLTLPIRVTVYDFDLPDARHLQMVGRLGWDRLQKLYPAEFENFTPQLLNRREGKYQATVSKLDHLVSLAEENRATLVVPALKPVVKWPGIGPQCDWSDFDSIVEPWLNGEAFPDHVGLHYWPLPEAELLERYDPTSRLLYWSAAADHFDTHRWLDLTAVSLENPSGGRVDPSEAANLSVEAEDILKTNPDIRVLLPLEDDQIQIASKVNPAGVDPDKAARLLDASPGLVSTAKPSPWGNAVPRHWLRTDLPGLVPYIGAGGDERDVRVWAWLAFLRHLDGFGVRNVFEQNYILWNTTLPLAARPDQRADPGELIWFYPGDWFGVDMPVPTIQMKWLRRAQQDYEYLLLAQERGQAINALQLARLITKPVELEQGQRPDPAYALLTGTSNQQVWVQAEQLLADTILLRKPGQDLDPAKEAAVNLRTIELSAPQEHRMLMGRGAQWKWNTDPPDPREPGMWVNLNFALDIYNASEMMPNQNRLRWGPLVPVGWELRPQEVPVPKLETYHIQRAVMPLKFNLNRISPSSREPIELQFIDGFTQTPSTLKFVLPVAVCDKREGELLIDGVLDDWTAQDVIHDGPMVRMYNRPALQRQELQRASTNSTVYSSWGPQYFYMAFELDGIVRRPEQAKNFVEYQQRRAWGEDLCEMLIQPVYRDNKLGPVLHVVCKPNGGIWLERKTDTRPSDGGWKPIDSSAIRYFAKTPDGASTWTGELAIPWNAIMNQSGDPPTLLRFNFAQHKASTGESATWAGPVDYGRDETFMGLLYIRSPAQNGLRPLVGRDGSIGGP